MPLIDLLRPDQRAALRRLRKRIANRENMRRYRSDINYMQLCPGVDLPLEAGTCGRLIWPESNRCIYCHNRRMWLLKYASVRPSTTGRPPTSPGRHPDATSDPSLVYYRPPRYARCYHRSRRAGSFVRPGVLDDCYRTRLCSG